MFDANFIDAQHQVATSRLSAFSSQQTALTLIADSWRLNLVELTGIEPVASWLQTRRSPS